METSRGGGWSWWLICRMPDWILKIRIAFLRKREETDDIKGEIADCKQQLGYSAFSKRVRGLYVKMFKEPFPGGPVWPRKHLKKSEIKHSPPLKTIVISKKEMDESYKDYERRLKEIRKDFNL